MSKISDFRVKIHALTEIQSILGAMKNIAVIEMNKVSRIMSAQERASRTIGEALADFESFYRKSLGQKNAKEGTLCILIGSERGFCGPFNEKVIARFEEAVKEDISAKAVVIGRKLAMKVEGNPQVEFTLDGPNSVDEIPGVIQELAEKLLPHVNRRWMFIHNDGHNSGGDTEATFPLETRIPLNSNSLSSPPLLNMPPQELYPQLLEQLLYSVIHSIFYVSFFSENRERLRHMEGAVSQIDSNRNRLSLKLNSERQEEITEELEILMLSSLCKTDKENL